MNAWHKIESLLRQHDAAVAAYLALPRDVRNLERAPAKRAVARAESIELQLAAIPLAERDAYARGYQHASWSAMITCEGARYHWFTDAAA